MSSQTIPAQHDTAAAAYQASRRAHWDRVAQNLDRRSFGARYYHRRLVESYRHLIPEGSSVLELGSGTGNLLAALRPGRGVGVDFSQGMADYARQRHADTTNLRFVCADAHMLADALEPDEKFDFIILSDLIHDVWDLQTILEAIKRHATARTRVILNFYSRLWETPLRWAKALGLARPVLDQNWFVPGDVANLLNLSGYEVLRRWQDVLLPLPIPGLAPLCNRFLVKLWPLRHLALTNFMIARPMLEPEPQRRNPTVSVIVAARNEAGNIDQIFARTPDMQAGTELIFVEGGSSDNTYEAIERAIAANPHRKARLFRQTGKGKGDAVRLGFAHATGDVILILDADLTVPPEDLPRFVQALVDNRGEFINGVRLVYPMQDQAMRFLNLVGNKFFSAAFSWLLGQPVKDTLCGTKVMWRDDYQRLAANRHYFGDFDPYGDFDLIFGAARLNLKIVDLPIRYRQRTYGTTNINRWSGGWLLLKMVCFAATRIKFI